MATIRETLRGFFSSGKKPTEEQFHKLIESYFHKLDDGLSLSPEKNLGIGTGDPKARLHIEGGLKIGLPTEDLSQISPGTMQWTGTKLQIFFAGAWQNVWSSDTNTTLKTEIRSIPLNPTLQVKKNQSKQTPTLDFVTPPNTNAKQLLNISLDLEYKQSALDRESLVISVLTVTAGDNKEIWSTEEFFRSTTTLLNPNPISQTLRLDVKGIVNIENKPKFFVQFNVLRNDNGGGFGKAANLEVTIKKIEVTCLLK